MYIPARRHWRRQLLHNADPCHRTKSHADVTELNTNTSGPAPVTVLQRWTEPYWSGWLNAQTERKQMRVVAMLFANCVFTWVRELHVPPPLLRANQNNG